MKLKGIIDEDFVNYKDASMVLMMPYCSFKCEKDCGVECCQNSSLTQSPIIEVSTYDLIERYMNNPITSAVTFGGLEPFDSWDEMQCFIFNFRYRSPDPIIIYTGYKEEEIDKEKLKWLSLYSEDGDIIVKFGRFIPDQCARRDEILGVDLASPNQYAKVLRYEDYT